MGFLSASIVLQSGVGLGGQPQVTLADSQCEIRPLSRTPPGGSVLLRCGRWAHSLLSPAGCPAAHPALDQALGPQRSTRVLWRKPFKAHDHSSGPSAWPLVLDRGRKHDQLPQPLWAGGGRNVGPGQLWETARCTAPGPRGADWRRLDPASEQASPSLWSMRGWSVELGAFPRPLLSSPPTASDVSMGPVLHLLQPSTLATCPALRPGRALAPDLTGATTDPQYQLCGAQTCSLPEPRSTQWSGQLLSGS